VDPHAPLLATRYNLLLLIQVLDLGVTRLLVHRLVRVFPYICEGYYPLCETIWATFRVANKRIEFMGRRSRASRVPPGYAGIALLRGRDVLCPFGTACVRRRARGGDELWPSRLLDVWSRGARGLLTLKETGCSCPSAPSWSDTIPISDQCVCSDSPQVHCSRG